MIFLLRSKITAEVLRYFFLNPSKRHYINELSGILNVDVGNLFRKLRELEKEGALVSEKRGNQKYYGLNKKYPLLKELKRIYEAKYGIVETFKKELEKIDGIKEAYIFGSYAKGNWQADSDLDILLIGDHSSLEAKRKILPLTKTINREINIIDITPKEFKKRQQKRDDFVRNVFSGKIIKIL